MMTSRIRMIVLPALLLVTGCSLITPPANFYTLTPTAAPVAGNSNLAVGLDLTEFPDALDRPQIMLRTDENRLEIQELDRWAGPLDRQFILVLTENLINLTGSQRIGPTAWDPGVPPDRRLSLAVLRFDGRPGGTAILRVRWSLADTKGQILTVRTSTLEEPAGADIESLVAVQSKLITRFAEEIAVSLVGN